MQRTSVASQAQPAVVAKRIIRKAGGEAGSDATPFTNRVTEVNPVTAVPASAYGGAQTTVEFELPQTLGKVVDAVVRFNISVNSEPDATVTLVPTSYWISRLEESLGSAQLQSVESDVMHTELTQATGDEYATIRRAANLPPNFGAGFATPIPLNGQTRDYFLPLKSSILANSQPYIKGITPRWRLKLTLPASIVASSAGTDTVLISLRDIKLFVITSELHPQQEAALMAAHRTGVQYPLVIRTPFQQTRPFTAGIESAEALTTFNNQSAGVVFWLRQSVVTPANCLQRFSIDRFTIRDSNGTDLLHPLLDGSFSEVFLGKYQVPSIAAAGDGVSVYVSSFSSSLNDVAASGKFAGGLNLDGQQRIVVVTAGSHASVTLSAVSYDYARLKIQGGQPILMKRA